MWALNGHSLAEATLPHHQDLHVPVGPRGLDPGHCGKCCAHILRQLRGCIRQQALAPLLIEAGDLSRVLHFVSGRVFILLCVDYAVSPADNTAYLYLLENNTEHELGPAAALELSQVQ